MGELSGAGSKSTSSLTWLCGRVRVHVGAVANNQCKGTSARVRNRENIGTVQQRGGKRCAQKALRQRKYAPTSEPPTDER